MIGKRMAYRLDRKHATYSKRVTVASIELWIDITMLINNVDVEYEHSYDVGNKAIDDFCGWNAVDRHLRAS